MIKSKDDLKEYMQSDMAFYNHQSKKDRFICFLSQDPSYLIRKYIRFLRKEEYYHNVRVDPLGKLMYLFYFRRKNILGNKLGFKIPQNCIGPGLTIYHHGEIIINESVKIGKNCKFHGRNCIGNNGIVDKSPHIGDNLDCGIGAVIVGDVTLGNHIHIGANAVVTKSFREDNITLVGIPAQPTYLLHSSSLSSNSNE